MKLRELIQVLSNADKVVIQSCGTYGGKLKEITIAPNDLEREVTLIRPFNDELLIALDA